MYLNIGLYKCSSVITEIQQAPSFMEKYERSKCAIILCKLPQNFQILFELICILLKQNKSLPRLAHSLCHGAWHNNLPSLGSPTQQNQLSVICVACHLSFFHSHLLASLFFFLLTTSTKHCHWTITDSAQMTSEIALFPLPCTHMSQLLFGREWLHAQINRNVPLAIELTVRC